MAPSPHSFSRDFTFYPPNVSPLGFAVRPFIAVPKDRRTITCFIFIGNVQCSVIVPPYSWLHTRIPLSYFKISL